MISSFSGELLEAIQAIATNMLLQPIGQAARPNPSTKFDQNPLITVWVVQLTNKHTKKQPNKRTDPNTQPPSSAEVIILLINKIVVLVIFRIINSRCSSQACRGRKKKKKKFI